MPRISVSSEFFYEPLVLQAIEDEEDTFVVFEYLAYASGCYDGYPKKDLRQIQKMLAEHGFGEFEGKRFVLRKPPFAQEDGKPLVFREGEGR